MKGNLLELFDVEVKQGLSYALSQVKPAIGNTAIEDLTIFHAAILGRLIGINHQENGSQSIHDIIVQENLDGNILDQIEGLGEDPDRSVEIHESGKKLMDFLFQGESAQRLPAIFAFISGKLDIPQEEVLTTFHMVAPFSMSLIGQIVHLEQLPLHELSELLASNEDLFQDGYPGLAKILGNQHLPAESTPETPDADHAEISTTSPTTEGPATPITEPEIAATRKSEDVSPGVSESEPSHPGPGLEEKERFFKALWPWVALLIISTGALFFLNKFQVFSDDTSSDTTILPTITDTAVHEEVADSLPAVEKPLPIEKTNFLDSLKYDLEQNLNFTDTLRYLTSNVNFKNSSAVLTTKASDELNGIVSILQAYPEIQMGILLRYDTTFLRQNSGIIDERVQNLSNYFSAIGLDMSQYRIINSSHSTFDSSHSETVSDPTTQTTGVRTEPSVELLFYRPRQQATDSLNIQ